jgi:hypothetical protein
MVLLSRNDFREDSVDWVNPGLKDKTWGTRACGPLHLPENLANNPPWFVAQWLSATFGSMSVKRVCPDG